MEGPIAAGTEIHHVGGDGGVGVGRVRVQVGGAPRDAGGGVVHDAEGAAGIHLHCHEAVAARLPRITRGGYEQQVEGGVVGCRGDELAVEDGAASW